MKTVDAFRIARMTSFENFVLSGTCAYGQHIRHSENVWLTRAHSKWYANL